jgi:hypothetical protein
MYAPNVGRGLREPIVARARSTGGRTGALAATLPVVLTALALWAGPASGAVAPGDRAATRSYLLAGLRLDRTVLRNVGASATAVASSDRDIARECAGVLSGAAGYESEEEQDPAERPPLTARARGERDRSREQLTRIEAELERATVLALFQPDRGAVQEYANAVGGLSWSDPRIAPLVHSDVQLIEASVAPPVFAPCPDMRAWAQSGYHVLAPGTRALQAEEESAPPGPAVALHRLLKRFEDAPARAIIRRASSVRTAVAHGLAGTVPTQSRLRHALGLPETFFERRENAPVLGRGPTTVPGTTFVIRREAPEPPSSGSCRISVSVEFVERSGPTTSSSFGGRCVGNPGEGLSSGCGGEVETISAVVGARVRSVRLRLRDGRTITSRVTPVREGSRVVAGIYAQAIRSRPAPEALAELDRRGRVLRTLSMRHAVCPLEPKSAEPAGPTFVTLAGGRLPGGEPFSIRGVIVHFGRNQTSFDVEAETGLLGNNGLSELGAEANGDVAIGPGSRVPKPKAYPWRLSAECPPHPFVVIYGILAAPGGSVLARTPAGLVALVKVPLAARYHAGGPLVFGAFEAMPSELIVRRADGSALYTESLTAKATEASEYCAGYAEPTAG